MTCRRRLRSKVRFSDEARIGQKNGQVWQWAKRGTRPRQPADQRYDNAICSVRLPPGAASAWRSRCPMLFYTEAMQLHLDEISRHVAKGAHAVLLLDRRCMAHHRQARRAQKHHPDLPAFARAQLSPVENIWQYLRANWLSNRVFENVDAIIDAACEAWRKLIALPETITSIGMRDWAHIGQI